MSCKEIVTFNIGLSVITPIHIGDGSIYTKIDYIYDQERHRVGFLNPKKWLAFLIENRYLEEYEALNSVDRVIQDNGRKAIDNYKWLSSKGRNDILQSHPELFSSFMNVPESIRQMHDVHRYVKDVFGRPYIPGSSIKGMIRNAIYADLINRAKSDPKKNALIDQIWEDLRNSIRQGKNIKRDFFAAAEMRRLSNLLFLPITDCNGTELSKELQDPFRGILCSDSDPFSNDSLMLTQKLDVVVPRRSTIPRGIPLQRESIRPGSETRFTISLDLAHLRSCGLVHIRSATDILNAVREYRESVINLHEKLLTSQIDNESNSYKDFRYEIQPTDGISCALGGGIGFQSHSLIYVLAPDIEMARRTIVEIFNHQFPRVHTLTKDAYASPRTIKTTIISPDATYPKTIQKTGYGAYKVGICALREVD